MKYYGLFLICSGLYAAAFAQQTPEVYQTLEKYYNENAFEACIKMERQVQAFAGTRLDTLVSNSYFYIGDAYYQLGKTGKALPYFELEKKTLSDLSMTQTESYSNSLNNLAYLYLQQGNYARAGAAADELIVNDQRIYAITDDLYISTVRHVSDIYLQLDRLEDCESLLQRTLKAQRGNSVNRGILLAKLGDLYSYMGQLTKANAYLLDAIDALDEAVGESSPEYISTAISLGVLYMTQGKYPEAEEIFEVALNNTDPSEPAYPSILNNQALVLQQLGQLDRAEKTFDAVRKIDSTVVGTSHPDYAITLSNMGLVYADLKKFGDAEKVLLQAIEVQKKNNEGNTISFARKLNNLAKVYQLAGQAPRAVPLLEQALAIFRKSLGKESPEYATAAFNLGVAYWKAGKGEKGIAMLRASADIRSKLLGKKHPKYAESMLKIAEYQWHKKEIRNAGQSFGEVFDNYYHQIDETFPVLTEEEKTKFYYTNIREAFDKFNSYAAANKTENPLLAGEVYNYLINTKAAIMFATEKVKASIQSSGDSLLIRDFERWQQGKEQIAKLYSANQEPAMLDSLIQASNLLEKEITRKSAVFAGQFAKKRFTWQEVRGKLGPGEAAVEVLRFRYFDPENGGRFTHAIGYAFLIVTGTSQTPAMIVLANGADMEGKSLRFYRNSVKYNMADAYSYKNFFEPLGDYLAREKITRIFFSPDGVYNQININTIENPFTAKYLIDEYDVRVVTNTRELVEVKEKRNNDQSSVLIGYPKFNLDEAELFHPKDGNLTRGNTLTRGRRGGLLRYMRGEDGISVLPGTRLEIQKISRLFGERTSVFMNTNASERQTKSVDNPAVLHIATHGYFLEDEGDAAGSQYVASPLLNAGLILAGAENFLKSGNPINEEGDDGILTAFEAMNLNLDRSELVVLSACETGLGDVRNGEGVYGLQRAFKLAGARSIIMSLWNVDDDATQQLMTAFYEELLTTGDQHQSFRNAQQKVKLKYKKPFFWGAFIMVGI